MHRFMRTLLSMVGAVQLLLAVGFFFQVPLLVSLWPFPDTTPLTFVFVASILAAAAASQLWVVWTRQWAAVVGIALDYMVILGGVALFTGLSGLQQGNLSLFISSALCAVGFLFGVALLVWGRGFTLNNTPPMPRLVRVSFTVFALLLVLVSVFLLAGVPNVLPWRVTPALSTLVGVMFVGAAIYFVYGAVRPTWANAGGQLAGFLAYDLVLIVPFLTRLPTIEPPLRLSLWLYIAVVVYSGIVAVYYLLVAPRTRLGTAPPAPALEG